MPSSWQGVCNFVVEIIIFRVVVGGGGLVRKKLDNFPHFGIVCWVRDMMNYFAGSCCKIR